MLYAAYNIQYTPVYTMHNLFGTELAEPQNPCLERAYFLESET